MQNIVVREKYRKKIEPYIDKQIIKVLTGQRRVGKSYFLKDLNSLFLKRQIPQKNIIYINKEDEKYHNIKNNQDLTKHINKNLPNNKKRIYILIDEIQEIDNFEKTLRSFSINPRFDIYVTGSNSEILSSDLASYLTGRYIEIPIYPLDYKEFLKFHSIKNTEKSLDLYLTYGGMPFLKNLDLKEEIIFPYLQTLFNSIFFKDIVRRYSVRNIRLLENLVSFLADNVGHNISANSVSNFLKGERIRESPKTVIDYLQYLVSTYLVYEVRRKKIDGKKIFKINSKYYFNDLGLRNSLNKTGIETPGSVLENLIFCHLKSNGYNIFVGNLEKKEIDFIAEKRRERIYIQVAYQIPNKQVENREFGNLLSIKDNYRKIVVSTDRLRRKDHKGIEHMEVLEFLEKEF